MEYLKNRFKFKIFKYKKVQMIKFSKLMEYILINNWEFQINPNKILIIKINFHNNKKFQNNKITITIKLYINNKIRVQAKVYKFKTIKVWEMRIHNQYFLTL